MVLVGGFSGFEKLMKVLIGVMFFTILGGAAVTFGDPAGTFEGLLLPTIPAGSGTYVLSLVGGVGGTLTLLSYNYWMREEGMLGPRYLKSIRSTSRSPTPPAPCSAWPSW